MPRTQNDTGRALEYILAEKFYANGFKFGPLASQHQQQYSSYFNDLPKSQQAIFLKSADSFYEWYIRKFPNSDKLLDALPDNSGSAADLIIGQSRNENNFSVKHNNLAMRHNRPHGLPNRCGLTPQEGDDYLNDLYEIEKRMRKEDPAKLFRDMKNKAKWMELINQNAITNMNKWKNTHPNTINEYFNYLTSNDRPYYKIEVSDRFSSGVTIHEFLSNKAPKQVKIGLNQNGYVLLEYDNGWSMTKRIHNASSRVDTLSNTIRSSTGDWKWDVQLVNHPHSIGYQI